MDVRQEDSKGPCLLSRSSASHTSSSCAGSFKPGAPKDLDSAAHRGSTDELRAEPFDNVSHASAAHEVHHYNAGESAETPGKALKWEPLSRSRRFKKNLNSAVNRWWILETASCAGSLLGLTAIIVFLAGIDGRSQPELPYNITPNSIISWFATLMKALMLVPIAACISQAGWVHFRSKPHILKDMVIFDAASRGLPGSLRLLGKFWQRFFACSGAFITVLALGIDPIAQQLIIIKTRSVDLAGMASLGRAESFFSYDLRLPVADWNPEIQPRGAMPALDMVGAIFEGIFFRPESSSTTSLEMSVSCHTGNCTFPPFQSLAVGSSCEDVTHALNHTWHDAGKYYEIRLPNGLRVNNTNIAGERSYDNLATTGFTHPIGSMRYGNSLFNFTMINTDKNADSLDQGATATQCFLYWCVNTYKSWVTNGQFHEIVQESWHSNTTDLMYVNGTSDRQKKLVLVPPLLSDISPRSNFTVASIPAKGLSRWLEETLSSSNGYDGQTGSGAFASAPVDIMRNFQSPNNMTMLFASLAKAITRNIRNQNWTQHDLSYASTLEFPRVGPVNGTATTLETYVHVRWAWLVFPAALVGFTILFLTLTMVDTARGHLPVWKSSPLPFLFHGLEGGEECRTQTLKMVNEIAEMEILAEQIDVRLTNSDAGSGLLVTRT